MPELQEGSPSDLSQRRREAEKNREINLRAPISRLPPELLWYIFRLLKASYIVTNFSVEEESEFFGVSFAGYGPDCWIAITHVCHTWRAIALDTPSLWSHIIAESPNDHELVMEMLRRSKKYPLTIELDFPLPCLKDREGVIEFRKHIPRCRTLILRQACYSLPFLVLGGLQAPLLEYLDIRYHPCQYRPTPFTDYFRADSLRRLSLENSFIHWGCRTFSHLTHLRLIRIPVQNRLPCQAFVAILAGISALEVLHLNECLFDCYGNSREIRLAPKIKRRLFGCLKFIYLSFTIREMALFLNNVVVTPSCRLFLSTWNRDPTPLQLLGLIFGWLLDHFGQLGNVNDVLDDFSSSYLRTIHFRMHHDECSLRGYNKMATFAQPLEISDKVFEFAYITDMSEHVYLFDEPTLRGLLLSLPLCRLQAVVLCMSKDDNANKILHLSTSFFRDVFSSLSTLEELLLDLPLNNFSISLLPTPDETTRVPFPALTSLILRGRDDRYQEIFEALRRRSALGLQIKEVLIPATTSITISVKGFGCFYRPIEQLGDLLSHHSPSLRIFRCNTDRHCNDSSCEWASADSDESSDSGPDSDYSVTSSDFEFEDGGNDLSEPET